MANPRKMTGMMKLIFSSGEKLKRHRIRNIRKKLLRLLNPVNSNSRFLNHAADSPQTRVKPRTNALTCPKSGISGSNVRANSKLVNAS